MTTDLIPKNITAVQLFSENGLDPVLDKIKEEIDKFEPDVDTDKGRKEIASFAYKIAQSKTFIEKAGKQLVSGIKEQAKKIDAERKRSRDTLDLWKEQLRKPLTEYEEAEKKRAEEERKLEIFNMDHEEALAMNDLFDREMEVKRKEAELARIEEEKRQKEEEKRLEEQRIAKEKAVAEKKAADKRHQASINNKVLQALVTCGIQEDTAKAVIREVAGGNIPHMRIEY